MGICIKEISPEVYKVGVINKISKLYPKLRSASKAPTFALAYFGTYKTLMDSSGLTEELAKQVERNYHNLYKVSDNWINGVLDQAHKDGYIECAFGLRLRTPILAKTPLSKRLNYKAEAERRSAGNAKTQSYGLLNNRAAIEFSRRVAQSPYRYDILICSLIHDAIYILIRDRVEVIEWANTNLVECMQWQEAPELQHDQVKLGAELDIFYPSWNDALTLTNNMTQDEIIDKGRTYFHKHASNKYMGKSYAECAI